MKINEKETYQPTDIKEGVKNTPFFVRLLRSPFPHFKDMFVKIRRFSRLPLRKL